MGNKRFHISLVSVVALVAVAAAILIAYSVGRGMSQSGYNELLDEIEELKAKEKEATIVKRVSQQMEAIAYDQMNISIKQRDRAEEQSRLAEANAARAEEQSRLAQENAQRARQQSLLAERNAEVASRAAEEARQQRDAATYSKSISDTLSFRTLSRSLGTTALAKIESKENDQARILAYTSWYFAEKYKGNPYQRETFHALMEATGAMRTYSVPRRSAVNSVAVLKGNRDGCVAVTNYGEVVLIENGKMYMLMQDNLYDFRSVWLNEKNIFALSYAGDLCVLNYEQLQNAVKLLPDKYFQIIQADASTLLLAARNKLVWFDMNSMKTVSTLQQSKELSTVVKRKNTTLLFYKDGSCAEMDGAGNVKPRKNLANGVVTAALYVESEDRLFLGLKDGDIVIINGDDYYFTTLSGHVAQITGLTYDNKTLVSSCFDREMLVWYIPKLKNTRAEKANGNSYDKAKGTPTEWLVPADYSSNAWAMSVSTKGIWAWLGLSDGRIVKYCISATYMAKQAYAKMDRGLTADEWIQYVGSNIEYEKLK